MSQALSKAGNSEFNLSVSSNKGIWVYFHIVLHLFTKGNNFCDFLLASLGEEASSKPGLLLLR